jgi:hypothetical protein
MHNVLCRDNLTRVGSGLLSSPGHGIKMRALDGLINIHGDALYDLFHE